MNKQNLLAKKIICPYCGKENHFVKGQLSIMCKGCKRGYFRGDNQELIKCSNCAGKGKILVYLTSGATVMVECSRCKGTGVG